MLLIPAIDLKDGQCVRLQQGDMTKVTTFNTDPVEQALHWLGQGARHCIWWTSTAPLPASPRIWA